MAQLQAAEFKKRQAELAKLQPQWLKEEMEVGLGLGLGLGSRRRWRRELGQP